MDDEYACISTIYYRKTNRVNILSCCSDKQRRYHDQLQFHYAILGTSICSLWSKSFAWNMCQNHNTSGQTDCAKCGGHSFVAGC